MPLGYVAKGSLSEGIVAYIREPLSIEDFPVGSIIKVRGTKHEYIGMIVDAGIEAKSPPRPLLSDEASPLIDSVLRGASDAMRKQWVKIALIAQRRGELKERADTMPAFFSALEEVGEEDIRDFYGREDGVTRWSIGVPKTIGRVSVMVPIDVSRLISLHFGIFGKTGTGKTFLGNILASLIAMYDSRRDPSEPSVKMLIFDMHSEYSRKLRKTGGEAVADGVGEIFKESFLRYTVDEEESRKYGFRLLRINLLDVEPGDVQLLAKVFGLTQTFADHIFTIRNALKRLVRDPSYWFVALLMLNSSAWEELSRRFPGIEERVFRERIRSHDQLVSRFEEAEGMRRLRSTIAPNVSKLVKLLKYPLALEDNPLDEIVENLTSRDGKSVIISFGRYEKETDLYMFIANMLAKKLRNKIMEVIEEKGSPETRVVIFLEEAHYFLGRETYRISPFGEIAREMRKKGVTLCVIDQKPYELDPDVITMLWTVFVFNLSDRRDVESAVYSAPSPELFKDAIPRLKSREVFVYGFAVEQPIVLEVRDYAEFVRFIKEEKEREADEGISLLEERGL